MQLYIAESNPSANYSSKHLYSLSPFSFYLCTYLVVFFIYDCPLSPKNGQGKYEAKFSWKLVGQDNLGAFWEVVAFHSKKKRHYYHGQRNSRRIVNGHLIMPD